MAIPSRILVQVFLVVLATLELSAAGAKAQEATNPASGQSRQDWKDWFIAGPSGEVIGPSGNVIGIVQPSLPPDAGLSVPYGPGPAGGSCGPYDVNPADEGGISSDFDFEGRGLGGVRSLSIFGGVHGFRTPADVSHSGNFGLHEGLNYGGPLGDPWEYFGVQVGADDAQSNFTGDQAGGAPRGSETRSS